MMKDGSYLLLILVFVIIGCKTQRQLPKETYYEFNREIRIQFNNDSLSFYVKNPLLSPFRITFSSKDSSINNTLLNIGTTLLYPFKDTSFQFYAPGKSKTFISYQIGLGDAEQRMMPATFHFPFPKNKVYKIIQGYNGPYSHSEPYHKYALDFNMKIGDTVCAADDGYVVGVIKDYRYSGTGKEWQQNDKSNYMTLYHPKSGMFTQYVHLMYQGSFVSVGDSVMKGQPIGLSGMTGYTDIPHLHFNVLVPEKGKKLISYPAQFENGIDGNDLKKGMEVRH